MLQSEISSLRLERPHTGELRIVGLRCALPQSEIASLRSERSQTRALRPAGLTFTVSDTITDRRAAPQMGPR